MRRLPPTSPRVTLMSWLAALSVAAAMVACDPEPSAPGRDVAERPPGATATLDRERRVAACRLPRRWLRAAYRGWRPGGTRAHDIAMIPNPPNYVGSFVNTSHSGPFDFLQQVPLLFYGPGFVTARGSFDPGREVTLADVAPTYAQLLGLEWPERDGRPIEGLLDTERGRPKLIVTVTIDGGGWNVLERWPDSTPRLRALMAAGANVEGARVGSSPSVTPAVHTNISTGTFPRSHGVTAIVVRTDQGPLTGAFSELATGSALPFQPTRNLRVATIGDLWDRAMGNRPKVGLLASGTFVLGMLGRGAAASGGDKDIAGILHGEDRWITDRDFYSLPGYINTDPTPSSVFKDELDRSDGQADGRWREHELESLSTGHTPALAPWQTNVARTVMEREGFGADDVTDLFYIHYKSPDHAGHRWNMIAPEQSDVLASVDRALEELVEWLDEEVGENDYLLVATADHGQTPLDVGGWPINRTELIDDIERRFDEVENDTGVINRPSPTVLFTNVEEMEVNGVTASDIATFLGSYTIGDNLRDEAAVPEGFENRVDESIFAGAFPGSQLDAIAACAGI